MGHLIGGGFLKAKTEKAALAEGLERAREFAYYNGDRYEGSDNYDDNSFQLYYKEFETEEEAQEFFNSLGAYEDGIVKVKCATKASQTRYMNKVSRYKKKIRDAKEKHLEEFKARKSKSVGCKKCGHRESSESAIKHNLKCPECGELYGSEGYKRRIKSYYDKIAEAELEYSEDRKETGTYRYWAKYEVHS